MRGGFAWVLSSFWVEGFCMYFITNVTTPPSKASENPRSCSHQSVLWGAMLAFVTESTSR